jgi:hypothetical protein
MIVHAKWSALSQSQWYEYVLRFALGGLTTSFAGAIAEFWGPNAGGLFLAFPAIFCASATLIEKHERERKQALGLAGHRRGREAVALDAAGAVLGSIGLMVFALIVWSSVRGCGFGALAAASAGWLVVSVAMWQSRRALRLRRQLK